MLVTKIPGLKLMIKYIHGDEIPRNYYVSEEHDEMSEELISSSMEITFHMYDSWI